MRSARVTVRPSPQRSRSLGDRGARRGAGRRRHAAGDRHARRKAAAKGCHTHYAGRAARTGTLRVTAAATGLVRARLRSRGDWDLGGVRREDEALRGRARRPSRGRELAEGFVTKGQRLIVQGCRFRGPRQAGARQRVGHRHAHARPRGRTQIVEVARPPRAPTRRRLQGLGLDLTESGDADSIDVVIASDAGRPRSFARRSSATG